MVLCELFIETSVCNPSTVRLPQPKMCPPSNLPSLTRECLDPITYEEALTTLAKEACGVRVSLKSDVVGSQKDTYRVCFGSEAIGKSLRRGTHGLCLSRTVLGQRTTLFQDGGQQNCL